MTYSSAPMTTSAWGMIGPRWQNLPFSGEGARLFGARWNMKGWPALYLSTDHTTAVLEYYQQYMRPGMLAPYRLEAKAIVDLTGDHRGAADQRVREAIEADWKAIAGIDGKVPPSWAIAQELIAAGAEGALVPSVQNPGGANLVLWRWHDAREAGEGAALRLLDPDAALGAR